MRVSVMTVLLLGAAGNALVAQVPSQLKRLAGQVVDTTLTGMAASMVDSLLGTGAAAAAGVACPAGLVPVSAAAGFAGVAPTVGVAPTAGAAIVGAARKKVLGNRPDSAAGPVIGAAFVCVAPAQFQAAQAAAMAQAQAAAQMQAPAPAAAMGGVAQGLMAATPAGAMAAGAVAAAPVAAKAAKALGGMLGGKGPSKAGMIKELAKGRLVLGGVRFIVASDALEDGFEDDLAMLAEALAAMSGEFVLNLPAEADDKTAPDTVMARRRLDKLAAHLAVAGVSQERLVAMGVYPPGLDPAKKSPKPGKGRPEVVKRPADFVLP